MVDYCWNLTTSVSTPSYQFKFPISLARYSLISKMSTEFTPSFIYLVFKEPHTFTLYFLI